jgi:hypothetical protein
VTINYSNYTLDELLDVDENIDRDKYPDRYKQLSEELLRRKQNGEFEQKALQTEKLAKESREDEFIIEFAPEAKGTNRQLFICIFILINVAVLAFVLPKYWVSDLSDIHQYTTNISSIVCYKEEVTNSKTQKVTTYFDLNIGSFQDSFSAVGLNGSKCRTLARDLAPGTAVSIWHQDGLIHQMKSKEIMLLSYDYMKPRVRDIRTENVIFYWFGLLALWMLLFKSLVNAFRPGTFTAN